MEKALPNKWIRKAISSKINNIKVGKITVPCYDMNVTGSKQPSAYVLMTAQDNKVDKANKCEWYWDSTITLDVCTYYKASGNTGSRLLVDNITDEIRKLTNNLVLDASSGLTIFTQTFSMPNNLVLRTDNEVVFRNIIKIDFRIA